MRTLREALMMSDDEKQERLVQLKETVSGLDVHRWADGFLASMTT